MNAIVWLSLVRTVAAFVAPLALLVGGASAGGVLVRAGGGGDDVSAIVTAASAPTGTAGGWMVIRRSDLGEVVCYVPADATPGQYRVVGELLEAPEMLAAGERGLALVYRPVYPPGDNPPVRAVREIRVVEGTRAGSFGFSALSPMPHLRGDWMLRDLVWSSVGPAALFEKKRGESVSGRLLKVFRDGAWGEIELPAEVVSTGGEGVLRLISRMGDMFVRTESSAWRWDASNAAWEAGEAGLSPEFAGTPQEGELVALGERWAFVGLDAEGGRITVSGLAHEAVIEDVEISHGLAGFVAGERLVFAWLVEDGRRLNLAVVDRTGTVLSNGAGENIGASRARGMHMLLLVVAGMVALSMLLTLLPGQGWRTAPNLPETVALAEPPRRLVATLMDFLPGLWMVVAIWAGEEESISAVLEAITIGSGPWPALVFASATIAHTTVLETVFGRTLGKAVVGCRVLSESGARVGFVSSLVRNTTKVLLPPIGLAVLARPWIPRPGSMRTWVVFDLPERPDKPEKSQSEKDEGGE